LDACGLDMGDVVLLIESCHVSVNVLTFVSRWYRVPRVDTLQKALKVKRIYMAVLL